MKTPPKTKPIIYRQGDLLIERIHALPKEKTRQPQIDGRVILAYGEATGHHHSLASDAAYWWKANTGNDQFLTVTTETEITHQEHQPIRLTPGNYRVRRQREYSPSAIRIVAD